MYFIEISNILKLLIYLIGLIVQGGGGWWRQMAIENSDSNDFFYLRSSIY